MKAIVDALNIIYDEDEKRGLIWLNVVSLFFTICAIAGAGLAIALVVVSPFAVADPVSASGRSQCLNSVPAIIKRTL